MSLMLPIMLSSASFPKEKIILMPCEVSRPEESIFCIHSDCAHVLICHEKQHKKLVFHYNVPIQLSFCLLVTTCLAIENDLGLLTMNSGLLFPPAKPPPLETAFLGG